MMFFSRLLAIVSIVAGVSAPLSAAPLKTPAEPTPAGVGIGLSEAVGPIYTTASGLPLYSTDMDERRQGQLGCTDKRLDKAGTFPLPRPESRKTCVDRWPPFYADAAAHPVGRWTLVSRPDGRKQWAFDDRPMYTSIRDKVAGDVNGTMGLERLDGWRTVTVPQRLPPGLKLLKKLDGLMLSDERDRLVFMAASKSAASGTDWTPVVASELDLPFDDWGVVARGDGVMQWTYKEKPLFHPKDLTVIQKNVAARNWQPIVKYPAKGRPEAITLEMTVPEIGWVYADGRHHTLYIFSCSEQAADQLPCDEVGDPASYWSAICGTVDQCVKEWHPLMAEAAVKPAGAWKIENVPYPMFKEVTGAYGVDVPTVRAWTYYGRPVYTFSGDKVPGEALGHCIRGVGSEMGAVTVLGDSFPVRP